MPDDLKQQRISFVGVGRMGANMARRLRESGYRLSAVFDIQTATAAEVAAELEIAQGKTLAEVTAMSDIVFTVVTDDSAMHAIYQGLDNLLIGAAGRTFINCATVTPAVHAEVQRLAEAANADSLEACMASSFTQAREGSLYLMCGGRETVFNKMKPLLADISKSLRYIGDAGKAAQVKALVNMVMNINTAALAEGLGLGDALGLDLDMLREVFSQTGADSRVLATDGEDMQKRDHACYFSGAHAAKDSKIALHLAVEQGLTLPLAAATVGQLQRMIESGIGDLDKSGLAELTFKGRQAG